MIDNTVILYVWIDPLFIFARKRCTIIIEAIDGFIDNFVDNLSFRNSVERSIGSISVAVVFDGATLSSKTFGNID